MQLILAADEKWGIGRKGGLLCHLPGDLKYFKERTVGKTVVMGRVTLESLPGGRGLPGRRNIVLTRSRDYVAEGCEVVHDTGELAGALRGTAPDDVMVIGGAEVYRRLLPQCDLCYITKIYADLGADRFFVDLDADPDFEARPCGGEHEENGIRYRFFIYERKDEK